MSLIVAVKDDADIVLASDGRVMDESSAILSEDSLKTLALNGDLCLGLAGQTRAMKQVLSSLGIKCRSTHPVDLLGECQEAACPVDVEYSDAKREITSVLSWMERRSPPDSWIERIPSVILAGRDGDAPALSRWGQPAWMGESSTDGYCHAIVGSLPEVGSVAWRGLNRMLEEERTTENAETRLARAVRLCARHFGASGPINGNVFLRRLSTGFALSRG
ncbi:hypothetical protein J7J63_04495 [Candidatus Bipolaricaulota bacterium]|nr:hypothetical protein [Candidatus Bipolaricaulota bacterium]